MASSKKRFVQIGFGVLLLAFGVFRLKGVWPDDYARLLFGLYRPAFFYQTLVVMGIGLALLSSGIAQPKTTIKKALGTLLSSVLGLVFTLVLVEVVLSASSLGDQFIHDRALLKPDARTMHAMRPNLLLDGQTPGDLVLPGEKPPGPVMKYRIRTDALGYRGWEGRGRGEVVFVGDSFTFAAHFPKGQLFPGIAARVAGVRGYNAGVPAIGPGQEAIIALDLASRLKPKVLVWQLFTGNDLLDQETFLEFGTKSGLDQKLFNFKKGLVLPQAFKKLLFFPRKQRLPPSFVLKGGYRHRYLYTPAHFAPKGLEAADRSVQKTVRETTSRLKRQGIRIVVVIFPPKLLAHYQETSGILGREDFRRALDLAKGWEKAAGAGGAEVLNLVKDWSMNPNLPPSLYLPYDTHLDRAGHRKAGEQLGEVLKMIHKN